MRRKRFALFLTCIGIVLVYGFLTSKLCSRIFILMDYPIHIDTISVESSIVFFKRLSVKFLSGSSLFVKQILNGRNTPLYQNTYRIHFFLDFRLLEAKFVFCMHSMMRCVSALEDLFYKQ